MKYFLSIFICTIYLNGTTISYKCQDINDNSFDMIINIDHNSLHFSENNKAYVYNYSNTVKKSNNISIHYFGAGNIKYLVHQKIDNPIDIYIDDMKNGKLRYEYKCKHSNVININRNIPITWQGMDKKTIKKYNIIK